MLTPPKTTDVTYLGDGLYCENQEFQFRLFTQTGMEVFLDGETLGAFLGYVEKCKNVIVMITPVTPPKVGVPISTSGGF